MGFYKMSEVDYTKDNFMVFFSGGLDSTRLLIGIIEELKNIGKKQIYTVYVNSYNLNQSKVKLEKMKRKILIDKISKEFDFKIIDVELNQTFSSKVNNSICNEGDIQRNGLFAGQSMVWLTSFLQLIPQLCNYSVEVMFGNLLDDECTLSKYNYMQGALDLTCKTILEDSNIDIRFPLAKTKKPNIINYMYKHHKDLFYLTSSCEIPEVNENEDGEIIYTTCGRCEPCRHRKTSIFRAMLDLDNNIDEEVLLDKLDKLLEDREVCSILSENITLDDKEDTDLVDSKSSTVS